MSNQSAESESSTSPPCSGHPAGGGFQCLDVPELKRLQYFFGQVLSPQDFRDEQTYFREKLKLHNRCLHGFGVVCGLEVVPVRRIDPCDPEPDPHTRVRIRCGLAYDCAGNELVVRRDLIVDLPHQPPPPEPGETDDVAFPLWLSLCFCEQPADPSRPVLPDACGASPDCVFGKLRDAVRVQVSLKPPPKDESCDSCCSACADPCVLLARINDFIPGQPVTADQIHNEVRRPITPYLATRVEGVSWSHGAAYTADEAFQILEELKVRFTRPILTSTLRPGVVDVWVIEGGTGRHADIYNRDGKLEALKPEEKPTEADTLVFRADTDETLQDGDRVLITIRTSFLLDGCCRPVDGENVGGRVPVLTDSPFPRREPVGGQLPDCLRLPGLTSGNGSPAGTFESWFFVKDVITTKKPRGGKQSS